MPRHHQPALFRRCQADHRHQAWSRITRTRAFEITGTGKVPVWQWAEVVQDPGFLLEIRIPNQAANADPGAALAKITATAYHRAAAFLASDER